MGGSNSRGITVERQINEAGDASITISEAAAERIFGDPSNRKPKSSEQEKWEDLPGPRDELARQIHSEELERLKGFYENRIDALENKNKELYHTTTEQFAKTVEEVEQKFLKTTQPICQSLQADVLKCYQDNPKQSLNCSAQVKAFSDCVHTQRENLLKQKG